MHAALAFVLLGLSAAAEDPAPPPPPPPPPAVEQSQAPQPPPPPSLFGARAIERGRVLYGLQGWYALSSSDFVPVLKPIAGLGLGAGFDLSAGFDVTLPPWPDRETMEALELTARRQLPWSSQVLGGMDAAVTLEAIGARFGSKESAENLAGPRHATGLRDLNVGVGVPVTIGRTMTYSFEPFVMASIDLQPASNGPLTGPPPAWTLGWLFGIDAGYELRFAQVLGGIRVRPGLRLVLHSRKADETVTLLSTLAISAG